MIKYSVQCKKGHGFEAWFQSSAAFDTQAKRGLVSCPACGSTQVSKALMAPAVSAKTRTKGALAPARAPRRDVATMVDAGEGAQRVAMPGDMPEILRRIRAEIEAKSEYVGPRFAEEARKIHFDEAPQRGIHGEASIADVKSLLDDGIECFPLPVLPEDRN